MTRTAALVLGAIGAAAVIILTGLNLDAQGVYYDELHQAPAAFTFLDKHPVMFTYTFHGVPILNMSYSGAIKSNVYGLYLKYINPNFTVNSWRLLGILFVAFGVFGFYQIARYSLPLAAAVLFGILLLTDTSVLLTTRHDWGPTALSLSLRLVFVAVCLSIESNGRFAALKYLAAGWLVGIAMFEKLSAVVLLGPLCILLFFARRKTNIGCVRATGLGLFMGSLPLLLVNAGSYLRGGHLVSLSGVNTPRTRVDLPGALAYVYHYLALGQGALARDRILGHSSNPFWSRAEAMVMVSVFVMIVIAAFRLRPANRLMTLAACMVTSYAAVGVLLFLLPRETDIHHWALGTPFQYAAIALAAAAFAGNQRDAKEAIYKRTILLGVTALIVLRVPVLASVEASLFSGRTSALYDPSFTRMAELAARRSQNAVFIAADWGTATQVYCLGNGRDDLIYEPFWSDDPSTKTREIIDSTSKNVLYVLLTGMKPRFSAAAAMTLSSIVNSPNWQEVPVEKEFRDLAAVRIQKFVRRTAVGYRSAEP